MNPWNSALTRTLHPLFSSLPGAYASADDMAYLAYTGKIENHVRDALAVCLQRRGHAPSIEIGREHGRVDLVELKGTSHACELQAKARACPNFCV
ncbi:MAG TPA: hypothetical protein VGE36_10600 [Roseateles sp.]